MVSFLGLQRKAKKEKEGKDKKSKKKRIENVKMPMMKNMSLNARVSSGLKPGLMMIGMMMPGMKMLTKDISLSPGDLQQCQAMLLD